MFQIGVECLWADCLHSFRSSLFVSFLRWFWFRVLNISLFLSHSQCLSFSVLSTNVLLVCALLSVRTLLIRWFFYLFFDLKTAFGFWCVEKIKIQRINCLLFQFLCSIVWLPVCRKTSIAHTTYDSNSNEIACEKLVSFIWCFAALTDDVSPEIQMRMYTLRFGRKNSFFPSNNLRVHIY